MRSVDSILAGWEGRIGRWGVALLAGGALMAVAALLVTPGTAPLNHGIDYARLSVQPFDFAAHNKLQGRILTPVVAHVVGLRGERYLWMPILSGIGFLAAVYAFGRQRSMPPAASALLAAGMAFATPIGLALALPGYVDTTSYLLITLALLELRSRRWFLWFALALLNHESNVFAAPVLVWLAAQHGGWRHLWPVVFTVVPLFVYRAWVSAHSPIFYSADYYLDADNVRLCLQANLGALPYGPGIFLLGCFMAFKLFWCVPVAAWWRTRRAARAEADALAIGIAAAAAQLLIATDATRMLSLAFPAVLLGAAALYRERPEATTRGLAGAALAAMLIPTVVVAQNELTLLRPLWWQLCV